MRRNLKMKPFSLEEYLANPNKELVTRDGREVKIHCTNYYLWNQCIIAEGEGIGSSYSFNQYGQPYGSAEECPLDLFFAPEKHEGWVNIFEDAVGNPSITDLRIFTSKEDAEKEGKNKKWYVTTAKIEWEE